MPPITLSPSLLRPPSQCDTMPVTPTPPQLVLALDEQHLQPAARGGEGGGKPGRSPAAHHYIVAVDLPDVAAVAEHAPLRRHYMPWSATVISRRSRPAFIMSRT